MYSRVSCVGLVTWLLAGCVAPAGWAGFRPGQVYNRTFSSIIATSMMLLIAGVGLSVVMQVGLLVNWIGLEWEGWVSLD